jgi:hypothetical protein
MPLTAAQSQFFLYGWHSYPWALNPRPLSATLTATPTAIPQGASVVVTLPAGSQAGKVVAMAGQRSGAPDKRSPSAQVAGGGNVTLRIGGLQTGKTYYVRGEVVYVDGTQALTAVETTVVPA